MDLNTETPKRIFRLGTRKSLLAWTQSSAIAREIEKLNPKVKIELVGVVTQGDRLTNVELNQIEGKEFFVKELDDALLNDQVDFNVHSLKDLSSDRPANIMQAAVSRRNEERDIIIFNERVIEKIRDKRDLKIGTSSPRRLENVPDFLVRALPKTEPDDHPPFTMIPIRGNVNTRLERIHLKADDDRSLDGVVLALAGISRLMENEDSRAEISKLLQNTKIMVLPLNYCPTSPGQGALAIECRANDFETQQILLCIHDAKTEAHVGRERQLMVQYGGGCHQRYGITGIHSENLGNVVFKRGKLADGSHLEEVEYTLPHNTEFGESWDGMHHRGAVERLEINTQDFGPAVLVASSNAIDDRIASALRAKRVWTVGTSTWFKLASKGIWIEGCGEGFGVEHLLSTLKNSALQLPDLADFTVLTHANAADTYEFGNVLAPHKIAYHPTEEQIEKLKKALHIFWASGSQFASLSRYARPDAWHSSGPGKTANWIKQSGVAKQHVFPTVKQWRQWVDKLSQGK